MENGKKMYVTADEAAEMLGVSTGYAYKIMDQNTSLVGNIRAYTLSALYNALATISQYYASLVSHDMAESAGAG